MTITTPAASTAPTEPVPPTTPWYRRGWALAVAAVLLALLSFGSGFVAGNTAALFNGVLGVPAGGPAGPGWMDGDGDGLRDGRPGFGDRGDRSEPDDRD